MGGQCGQWRGQWGCEWGAAGRPRGDPARPVLGRHAHLPDPGRESSSQPKSVRDTSRRTRRKCLNNLLAGCMGRNVGWSTGSRESAKDAGLEGGRGWAGKRCWDPLGRRPGGCGGWGGGGGGSPVPHGPPAQVPGPTWGTGEPQAAAPPSCAACLGASGTGGEGEPCPPSARFRSSGGRGSLRQAVLSPVLRGPWTPSSQVPLPGAAPPSETPHPVPHLVCLSCGCSHPQVSGCYPPRGPSLLRAPFPKDERPPGLMLPGSPPPPVTWRGNCLCPPPRPGGWSLRPLRTKASGPERQRGSRAVKETPANPSGRNEGESDRGLPARRGLERDGN